MTEIFKCRKMGTKCCAPKYLIREAIGGNKDVTGITNLTNGTIVDMVNSTTSVILRYTPTGKLKVVLTIVASAIFPRLTDFNFCSNNRIC